MVNSRLQNIWFNIINFLKEILIHLSDSAVKRNNVVENLLLFGKHFLRPLESITSGPDKQFKPSTQVTSYRLTGDGDETPLTSMNRGRWDHACGVYRDAGGRQVSGL